MTNFFINKIQSKINDSHRLKLHFSAPKYAVFKGGLFILHLSVNSLDVFVCKVLNEKSRKFCIFVISKTFIEKMAKRNLKWKTLKSDYLFKRPWLTARRDIVELPDGRIYDEYYVLEYPDWVNVIAITQDGKMVMERQYRHARQTISTEICAGVMEKGEDPLTAAQRELQEETGYVGGDWKELLTLSPNSSAMTNQCHCFVAYGVEKTSNQHLDTMEDLEVFLATPKEVYQLLLSGKLEQALMVAPLWRFFAEFQF